VPARPTAPTRSSRGSSPAPSRRSCCRRLPPQVSAASSSGRSATACLQRGVARHLARRRRVRTYGVGIKLLLLTALRREEILGAKWLRWTSSSVCSACRAPGEDSARARRAARGDSAGPAPLAPTRQREHLPDDTLPLCCLGADHRCRRHQRALCARPAPLSPRPTHQRLNVPVHVAESLLGHVQPALVRTYAPSGVPLRERRQALDRWERELLRIVEQREPATVVTGTFGASDAPACLTSSSVTQFCTTAIRAVAQLFGLPEATFSVALTNGRAEEDDGTGNNPADDARGGGSDRAPERERRRDPGAGRLPANASPRTGSRWHRPGDASGRPGSPSGGSSERETPGGCAGSEHRIASAPTSWTP